MQAGSGYRETKWGVVGGGGGGGKGQSPLGYRLPRRKNPIENYAGFPPPLPTRPPFPTQLLHPLSLEKDVDFDEQHYLAVDREK